MTKISIESDEWYPVLSVATGDDIYPWRSTIEVDEDTLARFQKAFDDFDAVQAELHQLRRTAPKNPPENA